MTHTYVYRKANSLFRSLKSPKEQCIYLIITHTQMYALYPSVRNALVVHTHVKQCDTVSYVYTYVSWIFCLFVHTRLNTHKHIAINELGPHIPFFVCDDPVMLNVMVCKYSRTNHGTMLSSQVLMLSVG